MNDKKWLDFKHIKTQVGMEALLSHYGLLEKMKPKGDQLTGFCPLPCHTGQKKKSPSFSVNTAKNAWKCFSCDKGGNILDFVQIFENLSDVRSAAQRIVEIFPNAASAKPEAKENEPATSQSEQPASPQDEETPAVNPPLTFQLKNLDAKHPYLKQQGLSPETIAHFGVGYCSKGLMAGRIAIPVHNAQGQVVAYVGRAITAEDEAECKYKFPAGFRKELEIFNLHRINLNNPYDNLIVVEGFFDAMWLTQCGYKNTVALMGWHLSDQQAKLLAETIGKRRCINLFLDGDERGRSGAEQALGLLAAHFCVHCIALPDGQQPDSLPLDELAALGSVQK